MEKRSNEGKIGYEDKEGADQAGFPQGNAEKSSDKCEIGALDCLLTFFF
jgi:hypothetical protein